MLCEFMKATNANKNLSCGIYNRLTDLLIEKKFKYSGNRTRNSININNLTPEISL